jgi:flagellar hook-length control protein FliK
MKTSAILNPTNLSASPAPAPRQADAAPDMMFNQVLSREMAERAPAEATKPAARDSAERAPKNPSSSAPAAPAPRNEKTAAAEKPKSADAAESETEEETGPVAASAELLALVASLTQANAAGPAAPATAQPEDADRPVGEGKDGRRGDAGLAALLDSRLASDATMAEDAATGIQAAAEPAAPDTALPAIAAQPEDFTAAIESAIQLRTAKPIEAIADAAPEPQAVAAQAPLNNLQTAAAQAAEKLAPRVGTQDWNQALGQKVVWMVAGAQQSASLTLNPPDLGPLHVVLNVTNSHATATFTAAQPEVRQALENAMPKLREMLNDAGIQLGQANVGAGMPNNQQSGHHGGRQSSGRASAGNGIDDGGVTPARTGRTQVITGGNGLVDTFA